MAVLDRHVEVIVAVDEHAVGIGQLAFSPGVQEIAVAVQDDQGVIAPVEEIHPVLGVGDDGRLAQHPAFRQLLPVFHLLIYVGARAYSDHWCLLLSSESITARRVRFVLFAGGQGRDDLLMQFRRPLGDQLLGDPAQRMGDAQGLEPLASENAGVAVGRVQERLGTDDYRGDPLVLQGHGVVHTARGAGPSIRDASHHEITLVSQVVNDIVGGGTRVDILIDHDVVPELKVFVQQFFHSL